MKHHRQGLDVSALAESTPAPNVHFAGRTASALGASHDISFIIVMMNDSSREGRKSAESLFPYLAFD